MYKESFLARMMNYVVSGYAYFVALTLVLYMVSSLVAGLWGLAIGLLNISTSARSIISAPETGELELKLLHTIAFTIVLIKAYKILISYAQTRQVNIKFLVEMAIIAPTIEILFNIRNYPIEINIVFAAFAFCNLVAYLFFYKTLKVVNTDYEKEVKAICK